MYNVLYGHPWLHNRLMVQSTQQTGRLTHRRNQLVSNAIQFIQLNLQHCQSASALLIRQIVRLNMAVVTI